MLTLLTATGARPEAWAICERLMAAQTYAGPVRWVIVDDGPEPQPVTFQRDGWELVLIRPEPFWQPGQNTQARNLQTGLAVIGRDERVVVIEDDDWYSPEWLVTVDQWLQFAELVGECRARYFNVNTGMGKQLRNTNHASLCATACRDSGLAALRDAVKRRETFIDLDLWRQNVPKALHETRMTLGIKGLPGRGGIGVGHRKGFGTPMNLRDLIGEDAALYGW